MESSKKTISSTFTNLLANYVGRIWTSLLGFILIPVFVSYLGVEGYGLVGFYLSLTALLSILDLGIGSAINRELARLAIYNDSAAKQRQLVKTLEYIYILLTCVIVVLIFLATKIALKYWVVIDTKMLNSPSYIFRLMGIAATMQLPISFYQGGLMGINKQLLVNKILIFTGTLKGVGSIICLELLSPDIETFFLWQLIISFASLLIFRYNLWNNLPRTYDIISFSLSSFKSIWKFAATMSLNSIVSLFMTQLDKIILIKTLSLKDFGFYSIATSAASAIWMILVPFNNSVYPRLVQLFERNVKNDLVEEFHFFSSLMSVLLFPICAIFIFFSKEILFIWLNDFDIVNSVYVIFILLTIGTMLNGIVTVPTTSSIAFGWPMLITKINTYQSILIIPIILVLVKFFKGNGAASAWVVMNISYLIFLIPIFFKRYFENEKSRWIKYDTIFPLLISFSICVFLSFLFPTVYKKSFLIPQLLVTYLLILIVLITYFMRIKQLNFTWNDILKKIVKIKL